MPILNKLFGEYKNYLGQGGTKAAGFPQTYEEYSKTMSSGDLQAIYRYAKERYTNGVPKTYADFLSTVDDELPKGVSQRLTHHAIQAAGRQLGVTPRETPTARQATESLKTQGALLTEMPVEQDIETPTGAPRVDTQISTGLVGVDPTGQLPKPTITTGLDDVLPKVSVPEEGSFAPAPASVPSPTLRQPTAAGTMVTRKGEPTTAEDGDPTILGRAGAATARGGATTLDAVGGFFEVITNPAYYASEAVEKYSEVVGPVIEDLTSAVGIGDTAIGKAIGVVAKGAPSVASTFKKEEYGGDRYASFTGNRAYVESLVGTQTMSDLSIKNPNIKAALVGVEQLSGMALDLALLVGTRNLTSAEPLLTKFSLGAEELFYKFAPKAISTVPKAVGKIFGEAVTTPTAIRSLQVDWIQPFKEFAKSDFAVFLGAKESALTMQDSDASTLASIGEGIKAFGMGYSNGLFFEKIGLTPVKLASSIAVKTGTPIAGLATNMIGAGGVGFGADMLLQAGEQVEAGEKVDPDYYRSIAAGVAFAGGTVLHGRNIIANTRAGIRAKQWSNLMEMENKTIDYCLNNAYDAPTLNAKIDDMMTKRDAVVTRLERTISTSGKPDAALERTLMGIDAQTSAYRQVLLTQSFTKEIIQNPDKFRNEILDNPNLKAEVKDKLCQRIDAIVQEFDPINVESRRLQTTINDWQFAKTQLDPNDPMTAKKSGIYDKQIAKAEDRMAELSVAPTYYYKGEFYDTHGALIDALNKRYVDGTSSEVIVRNDPQASKLVNESLNQLLDRKFNEGVKVQQTQEIAKAESQPERDLAITQAQERLKLPTEPELMVSDQAVAALDRALAGESADVAKVQNASDQLYAETKRLEKMKDVDGRQYTIEQIETAQRQAFEDVAFAENYIQAKKAGETIDVKALREEAKATAEDAINDIRERRQILLPESVKAKLNAPKPETVPAETVAKVEPVKPVEDAKRDESTLVRPEGEQVPPEGVSDSNLPKSDKTKLLDRPTAEKEVTTWEELPSSDYVVLGPEGKPMVAGKERRAAIAREERSVRDKMLSDYRQANETRLQEYRAQVAEERLTEWKKENPQATETEVDTQRKKISEESATATLARAGAGLTDADVLLGARLATSYLREGVKKSADLFKEVSDNLRGALGLEITKQDFKRMMATEIPEIGQAPKEAVKTLFGEAAKSTVKRQIEEITGIRRKPEVAVLDNLKEARARYKEQEKVASDALKIGVKEGKLEMKEAAFDKQGYRDQLNQWVSDNKKEIQQVNPELTPAILRAVNNVNSWYTLDRGLKQIKKAISDKTYADNLITQDKLFKQVEKNLSHEGKSKFGTAQGEVADFLRIDPSSLPTELRGKYDTLLESMAAKATEVPYDPFQLKQFLDNAKVHVDEGYAAYRAKLVDKAVAKELAAKDVDKKMTANEREVAKRDIYSTLAKTAIEGLKFKKGKVTTGEKLINEVTQYSKEELMRLPSSTLSRLPFMVDKMAVGVVPSRLYQDVLRPVRSYKAADTIMKAFGMKLRPVLEELDSKIGAVREQLEVDMQGKGLSWFQQMRLKDALLNKPRYLLDSIFKGAKGSRTFYDNILSNSAFSKTRAEADATRAKISATNLWGKAYRAREKVGDNRFDSGFISTLYSKALEYESNKGLKGAHSPQDYFSQLVDYRKSYGVYTEQNTIRMRELWNKMQDANGDVTAASIKKLMLPEETAAVDYMRKWYDSEGIEKTREAEVMYRGGALDTYENYSHNFVVNGNNMVDPAAFVEQIFGGTPASNMSVRSATTHARSGQTGVISIDPIATFNRAVDSTYYDYHMTPAIQEALGAFKVMSDMATDKSFRDSLLMIENAYKGDITIAFENTMRQTTNMDKIMNAMGGAFYSGALSSIRRIPQEFLSNLSSAIIYDPVSFYEGSRAIMDHQTAKAAESTSMSSGYEPLFDFAGVTNRFRRNVEDAQRLFNDTNMAGSTIRTGKWDRTIDTITNNKVKNTFDTFNKSVISLSDDVVGTRFFVGKFRREYEKLAGEKFDNEKFNTDENYRFDNEQNIKQAAAEASFHTNLMTNTANSLEGIQALKVRGTSGAQVFRDINNTLSGFSRHEAAVMTTSLRSLTGNGSLSAQQAWALFASVTTRNIVYNTVLEFGARAAWAGVDDDYSVSNAVYDVFGKDQLARQVAGAWLQIGIGSRGNLLRMPLQFGLSKANQYVTEHWLGQEFDPEKHKLGMEGPDIVNATSSLYNAARQLGPYQMPVNLAIEGAKLTKTLATSSDEQAENEKWSALNSMIWSTQKTLLPLPFQRDMEGVMKQSMDAMEATGDLKGIFEEGRISKAFVGAKRTEQIQQQMEEAKLRNKE